MVEKVEAINESLVREIKLASVPRAERDARNYDRLRNKVVLITGGASGMGAAEARLFVNEGARVIIADIQDERGKELAEDLGDGAVYTHLDVRSDADWAAAVETSLSAFGSLTTLINNAGLARYGLIQDQESADWSSLVDIMLFGTYRGIKAVTPAITNAGGGSIIAISSLDGIASHPGLSAYSSAKFAVRGLVRSAALELGRSNIRVNAIIPGLIDTPLIRPEGASKEALAPMEEQVPLGYAADPHEIALAALYLSSDDSWYVSGSDLTVDGGVTAKVPLEAR
ncbi:SDR family NAD(P)-dependent oxidoreductase [Gordonia terrae]|uniref:3-oxoacyl-ACP reductase n=2 Tax=Gordonia terrae TaxID=2055 RepID=A0AAD0NZ79_9ACTN|nr:glucose 1-dehydrogenase [Gordonia terrae]VTR10804.1 dehydrogenase [Clostridioides difficile]ANY24373.1 3-alpha-hydroxysteroid dehydrogenase [Gordonia terrae]AWO85120.1 3-oxoacyl-ACP reductase [Gordonia terrae]VTS58664.1 3-alpha-(or 20-beta)-hydroxysteroid dehydrogenase [Gordonia terrae]GAB46749.1 putative oxidoreductase [Gordonia terrae NBRC 100016]